MKFPTGLNEIRYRLQHIDPVKYGSTRNFIDGAVTYLSPYISRGVISTKEVWQTIKEKGYSLNQVEKFVQELAWRDYWQQNWIALGDKINEDIRNIQEPVEHHQLPVAVQDANTGIEAIDQAIKDLCNTGYMHNHVRMYLAAVACNIGRSHWRTPARWMYYHLLDGDWASNTLSWQWVAGTNSNKKYLANQDNINKYCHSDQKGTFLDYSYEELSRRDVPEKLKETIEGQFEISFPYYDQPRLDSSLPTLIYNYYNMDPNWLPDLQANRVLLIEPEIFRKYPVAPKNIRFLTELGGNIPGLQVYIGELPDMVKEFSLDEIHFKEHPFNQYDGVEHPRDWLAPVTGYHQSFFAFWKKVKKHLNSGD